MYCVKCGKKIKNKKDGCSNCKSITSDKKNNKIYSIILFVIMGIIVMGASAILAINIVNKNKTRDNPQEDKSVIEADNKYATSNNVEADNKYITSNKGEINNRKNEHSKLIKGIIGAEAEGVILITEGMTKYIEIKDIEDSADGTFKIVTMTLKYDGKLVQQYLPLVANMRKQGDNWICEKLVIDLGRISESYIKLKTVSEKLEYEDVIDDLIIINNGDKFSFEKYGKKMDMNLYNITSVSNFIVESSMDLGYLTNMIYFDFTANRDYAKFDGNIKIYAHDNGTMIDHVKINNFTTQPPTEYAVQTLLVGGTLKGNLEGRDYHHVITQDEANTFKLNEIIDSGQNGYVKHVYGTMTYTENGNEINEEIYIMTDLKLTRPNYGYSSVLIYSPTYSQYGAVGARDRVM